MSWVSPAPEPPHGSDDPPPTAAGPPRLPTGVLAVVWAALGLLTVAATATVVSGAGEPTAGSPPGAPLLDVVVGVAVVALLPTLWNRRWCIPAAVVLAGLAALSGAETPAATAATLQVARWYPVRTAVLVATAGTLGHAVQGLWRPVGLPLGWWLLCDVAVHAALLGWGAYWQTRAVVLWSWRERARRAEREQERRVAEARLAERTRIAREMHDTLAHRLSLLAATAGALEFRPDGDPERLAEAAGRVRAGVSDALEDLRQVIRLLRAGPDDLSPVPRLADVDRLVEEARAAGGMIRYERSGDIPPPGNGPPPGVATAVFRVVQEGLTNARRHAPGAEVRVTVTLGSRDVTVRVSDDGAHPGVPAPGDPGSPGTAAHAGTRGPIVPVGTGTGIVGLRERATLLGGRVAAGPTPSGGFTLEAWLPWD